jgi:hypothetical protein
MSFFGSKLFGGLGGSSSTSSHTSAGSSSLSGAETIERLCERVQSASLIDDRREALMGIKSLCKKYKLEVGTQAMPVLIEVLKTSRVDGELCCLALDTLNIVFNSDTSASTSVHDLQPHLSNQAGDVAANATSANLPADLANQFTEMFIKEQNNVLLLFDVLDEFDFSMRWSTVKLLNTIVRNQPSALQEIILQIPRGVSRLMDLLTDTREVIRNDCILLLTNLARTNANIQKIVAFESGFDRIMEIIESEGAADGGIIVEDCFQLLMSLLQTNYSNQSYFKEANYIKTLCKFFELGNNANSASSSSELSSTSSLEPNSAASWSMQKTTNFTLLLKLIRALVSPSNQQQLIIDCQRAYNTCGLLHRLCAMLMMPGVPAELLSEAIVTVGEVIRGNSSNQQLFGAVMVLQTRPIVVILLMSMINEKQPFYLRCSILYCFQCYLYKNEKAKAEVVETLLPQQTNKQQIPDQITTGQLLCAGLFSPNDSVANWLCATAIAHTINDNITLKEQLLRVQLAVNASMSSSSNQPANSSPPQSISLMQQCMSILIDSTTSTNQNMPGVVHAAAVASSRFQTTVGIVMLMSTWLAGCSTAVNFFLSQQQNIPYVKDLNASKLY